MNLVFTKYLESHKHFYIMFIIYFFVFGTNNEYITQQYLDTVIIQTDPNLSSHHTTFPKDETLGGKSAHFPRYASFTCLSGCHRCTAHLTCSGRGENTGLLQQICPSLWISQIRDHGLSLRRIPAWALPVGTLCFPSCFIGRGLPATTVWFKKRPPQNPREVDVCWNRSLDPRYQISWIKISSGGFGIVVPPI